AQPAPPREKPAEPARPADKPAAERAPAGRTDDGSVALALLAGKTPSAARSEAKPAAGGRYYLQVAAYTTEQDAQARRDSLRQAGVSDAYVERGQSNGRTVYRLRVGPFGSHEAAQAAQARLRALGYQNGLISGK
ncbi:SPOR domain-containing protein, partial [Castellaniella defragrans]